MRMLVVDDELVSREKMQKILENYGTCETCEDGEDALVRIAQALNHSQPYILIALDISMPNSNGISTLRLIRKLEASQGVEKNDRAKVVMVTASADKTTVISAIKAGCDDYIAKPFETSAVEVKLRALGLIK